MKISTTVVAALFGFGSLVFGRPQEIGQNLTPSNELLSSSGSDVIPLSGNDYLANDNNPKNAGSPGDVNSIEANDPNNPNVQSSDNQLLADNSIPINPTPSDETGSPSDQPFTIASSGDHMGLSAAQWEADMDALEKVKNGGAPYVIYAIDTTQTPSSIYVREIAELSPSTLPWNDLIADMKRYIRGYAIYNGPKGLVPMLFSLNHKKEDPKDNEKFSETCEEFNLHLNQNGVFQNGDYQDGVKEY